MSGSSALPPEGPPAARTPSAQPSATALHAAIDAFFGDDGPLARRLPGYRARAPQREMAHLVAAALHKDGGRLAVEAGTGTGKSMAYLAAALLSGKRVVVTTGTKALQDQLYTRDVPLALACARELLGAAADGNGGPGAPAGDGTHIGGNAALLDEAVLVKGRQNYLCHLRYERFRVQPTFAFPHEAQPFVQITRWAEATSTGDRAELASLPEPYATWSDLDAGAETCVGLKCPHHEACFVVRVRRRADAARLVVANHHLLCADLRVRLETRAAADGIARVLPDVDAFILDEAHGLADVASDHFGVQLGSAALTRMLADVRRHADGLGGDDRAMLLDAALQAEEHVAAALAPLQTTGRERARLRLPPQGAVLCSRALGALAELGQVLTDLPDPSSETPRKAALAASSGAVQAAERSSLLTRVETACAEARFVLDRAPDDPAYVVVSEPARRGTLITAAPVDVAAALAGTLFAAPQSVVLTSATLAVAGEVRPFLVRVGAPVDGTVQRVLPSPFDSARRAALYCPTQMPAPNHPDYAARYLEEASFLLELTRGGALFLFTSTAALDEGHEALLPVARALNIPVFKQGEMQKARLLDELRAHDGETGALLCATRSFWEGVDVRGRALRLVVVDKLPFDVPTDPLRQARAELCRARGGDPFLDETLPDAALALKQGAGRLLRDVTDAGIIAVLDGRLRTKSYGRVFLETLPPLTRIGGRPALLEFWSRFVRPSLGLGGVPP